MFLDPAVVEAMMTYCMWKLEAQDFEVKNVDPRFAPALAILVQPAEPAHPGRPVPV